MRVRFVLTLIVLAAVAAALPAAVALASEPGRLFLKPSTTKAEYGKAILLKVTVENTGSVDIAWRVPNPPFEIREKGRPGAPAVQQDAPSEIIPCVAVGRCESVRLSPGKKQGFEVTISPSADLGIAESGPHEIEVRVRLFVFPKGGALAHEEWIGATFQIEMAGQVKDDGYSCSTSDARVRIEVQAEPSRGPQAEIRIEAVLTNTSSRPLTLPRRLGCPNPYEPVRLYPPGYRGRLEEVSGVYGAGVPEACPAPAEGDFVELAEGGQVRIATDLDPLTFPSVAPGPYEAMVTMRNDIRKWADRDENSHPLANPWTGCLRSQPVSLEILPDSGSALPGN